MEPIIQFEMHTMNNHDMNVKIMRTLRDLLIEPGDQWSLIEEGEWEEYAKPTGSNYGDADTDWYIEALEQRVYDRLSLVCDANGESGMYTVEALNDEDN